MNDRPPGLTDDDLPGLFDAADTASLTGQKEYMRALRARLVLAVAAAVCGVFALPVGGVDVAALGTGLALIMILLVEFALRASRPEERWYDGRALAESTKSLAWRYAVGAVPFALESDERAVERRYVDQVAELLGDAPDTGIEATRRPAVSGAMRALRSADLADRKRSYLSGRVQEQQGWYVRKSAVNARLARRWHRLLLAFGFGGIAAAFARAFGVVDFDLAGVAGALIAASAAWTSAKQHAMLTRAYRYAANELLIADSRLQLVTDETEWAAEAADAEEAISREHTMWRASRISSTT